MDNAPKEATPFQRQWSVTKAQYRKRIRLLRANLRYRQEMNRVDTDALRGGIAAAQRIGAEMRALQKEMRNGKPK